MLLPLSSDIFFFEMSFDSVLQQTTGHAINDSHDNCYTSKKDQIRKVNDKQTGDTQARDSFCPLVGTDVGADVVPVVVIIGAEVGSDVGSDVASDVGADVAVIQQSVNEST